MSVYLRQASPKRLAVLGLILSLVPFYFVTAAVLKYGFGIGLLFDPLAAFFSDPLRLRILNLILTPILFFGGLLCALALNLYVIFRAKVKTDGATIWNRFAGEKHGWNISIVVLSSLLLATITIYGILENFTRR